MLRKDRAQTMEKQGRRIAVARSGDQDLGPLRSGPFKHFIDTPFNGVVTVPGFPGFNPVDATALLHGAVARRCCTVWFRAR